ESLRDFRPVRIGRPRVSFGDSGIGHVGAGILTREAVRPKRESQLETQSGNPGLIPLPKARAAVCALWNILWIMGPCTNFARAQTPNLTDEEKLIADFTDPLTTLPQISLKDAFTPANFGTHVQTNQVILRPIIPRVPRFSLFPLIQLIRPTFSLVTVSSARGRACTEFGDMQLFDLTILRWPSDEAHFKIGLGPMFVFPTAT